jgi:hypothetical protein
MSEPTDHEVARRAVLDSAGEDEYGAWEILAAVRSALPDRDEATQRSLAAGAVRSLAGDGLVELVRGRALDGGPAKPADAGELDAPGAWEPAVEQPSYLSLRITPAGEDAYYAMLRDRHHDGHA